MALELELFTLRPWQDLLQEARQRPVPYFGVAVCHIKNSAVPVVFDAICLDRYVKQNDHFTNPVASPDSSPSLRETIVRIEYLFTKVGQSPPVFTSKEGQRNVDLTDKYKKIAFESNNYHLADSKKLGTLQFIFGVHLLKQALCQNPECQKMHQVVSPDIDLLKESYSWLRCSLANGNHFARSVLSRSYKKYGNY